MEAEGEGGGEVASWMRTGRSRGRQRGVAGRDGVGGEERRDDGGEGVVEKWVGGPVALVDRVCLENGGECGAGLVDCAAWLGIHVRVHEDRMASYY